MRFFTSIFYHLNVGQESSETAIDIKYGKLDSVKRFDLICICITKFSKTGASFNFLDKVQVLRCDDKWWFVFRH